MSEMTMLGSERGRGYHDHKPLKTSLHDSLSCLSETGVEVSHRRLLPV